MKKIFTFCLFSLIAFSFSLRGADAVSKKESTKLVLRPGKYLVLVEKNADLNVYVRRIEIDIEKSSSGLVAGSTMTKGNWTHMALDVKQTGSRFAMKVAAESRSFFLLEGESSDISSGKCSLFKDGTLKPYGTFKITPINVVKDQKFQGLIDSVKGEVSAYDVSMVFTIIGSETGGDKSRVFIAKAGGLNLIAFMITYSDDIVRQLNDNYKWGFPKVYGAQKAKLLALFISDIIYGGIHAENITNIRWTNREADVAEALFDFGFVVGGKLVKMHLMAKLVKKGGKWIPEKLAVPFQQSKDWSKVYLIYDRSDVGAVCVKLEKTGLEDKEYIDLKMELHNYSGKPLDVKKGWKISCYLKIGTTKKLLSSEALTEINQEKSWNVKYRAFMALSRKWKAGKVSQKVKGEVYVELEMDDGKVIRSNSFWFK